MSAPGTFLTAPNLLSLSRLPLGVVFWFALESSPRRSVALPALGVMGVAALTDVLDGYLARRRRTAVAGAGSWLDPICDKLFVGSVLGALYVQRDVPLGWLALIVARELMQLPMVLVYRLFPTLRRWLRYDFRASVLGKAATITQFLAIGAIIAGLAFRPIALAAFLLGLIALVDYVRRAVAIGRERLHHPEPPRAAGKQENP